MEVRVFFRHFVFCTLVWYAYISFFVEKNYKKLSSGLSSVENSIKTSIAKFEIFGLLAILIKVLRRQNSYLEIISRFWVFLHHFLR